MIPPPILAAFLLVAGLASFACGQEPLPGRPRLVVICAVDQLASWVLHEALPHCGPGGFRRLLREGTAFAQCAFAHGCSETGPGHATLSTAAPASLHGIVKNEWFDAASRQKVYCASDPAARALPEFPEGKGRGPAQLLLPTLGDDLKAHRGAAARVVSIAMKDRSAILLGGAAADAVVWYEPGTGRFVTNARYGETAPQWLLAFDAGRPVDAAFGWTWSRFGPPDAYAGCVDDRPFESTHPSSGGRTLPVSIRGGKQAPGPEFYAEVFASPLGNELVLALAERAVEAHGLGGDDVPDLLCVAFSANDLIGHAYGPESVEVRDALLRLDALLAGWLERLDRRVGADRYLFLLSSDHGVGPTPEAVLAAGASAGRGPLHARARAAADKAVRELFGVEDGRFVIHAGEQAMFLDRDRIAALRGGLSFEAALERAAETAAAAALRAPGVLATFVTSELLRQGPGLDPIRRAMYFAVHPQRAGDVLLVFRPYWLEGMTTASHGSPHSYDREVPLLAFGAGIARGRVCEVPVTPGLVAVLAARALGIPRPTAAVDDLPPGVLAW